MQHRAVLCRVEHRIMEPGKNAYIAPKFGKLGREDPISFTLYSGSKINGVHQLIIIRKSKYGLPVMHWLQ